MDSLMKNNLLVDVSSNVKLNIAFLSGSQYINEIIVAEDGEDALDFLYHREKFADYSDGGPAFSLLNIKMPGMDGIEDLKIGYQEGANSFDVKPTDYSEFMPIVNEIGQYWYVINEHPVM